MATIQFKGKSYVQNHHLTLKYHHLVPNPDASLTDKVSLQDNLIIHGDNLLALKALLPTYAGKVKCIYIDPPYNTGNEGWIYNDNVNSPMMQSWLKANSPVDKEDLARHDKWLCMMMPRLKLLRELLRDDGVIFVSIDDNEVHHLRMLMDEIFGEENYRNSIVVRRGTKNVQSQFENIDALAIGHETILIYTLNSQLRLPKLQHNLGEVEAGKWDTFWRGTDRRTMRFELFGIEPESGQWRWSKDRSFKAKKNYEHYLDNYSSEMSLDEYYVDILTTTSQKLDFIKYDEEEGSVKYYVPPRSYRIMSDAWMDLRTRGDFTDFPTEKHPDMIRRVLIWTTANDPEAIVLDSFAGSGVTAHAVLSLNQEDKGNRKFILIEMEDYAESLTMGRVRKVIKGIPESKDKVLQKGLGGSFSFFDLGNPIEMQAILDGDKLPDYEELARYVFYNATGDEFDPAKVDEKRHYIGENHEYEVYLFYQPSLDYLRSTAFDLDKAENLGRPKPNSKKRLVFAPMKFLDSETLEDYKIEYCQLPFEIYKFKE
ncbi:site-specific DNA-methyltransferase [filamentous cyanobacterium CCP5]|nr:site-specific DNA-methyltransferase [filamentous cyanobacterium CCP5]